MTSVLNRTSGAHPSRRANNLCSPMSSRYSRYISQRWLTIYFPKMKNNVIQAPLQREEKERRRRLQSAASGSGSLAPSFAPRGRGTVAILPLPQISVPVLPALAYSASTVYRVRTTGKLIRRVFRILCLLWPVATGDTDPSSTRWQLADRDDRLPQRDDSRRSR